MLVVTLFLIFTFIILGNSSERKTEVFDCLKSCLGIADNEFDDDQPTPDYILELEEKRKPALLKSTTEEIAWKFTT
uniref:Uncharacterized protein n=1 Tax=Ditylenchus dipsaci TaxID=166011 RepID=A0A915D5W8_9BILA